MPSLRRGWHRTKLDHKWHDAFVVHRAFACDTHTFMCAMTHCVDTGATRSSVTRHMTHSWHVEHIKHTHTPIHILKRDLYFGQRARACACTRTSTRTQTHAHAHAYAHARTHPRTHTHTLVPETEEKRDVWYQVKQPQDIHMHTATHCNTLQHTATHCNTLQHTARIIINIGDEEGRTSIHTATVTVTEGVCVGRFTCGPRWMKLAMKGCEFSKSASPPGSKAAGEGRWRGSLARHKSTNSWASSEHPSCSCVIVKFVSNKSWCTTIPYLLLSNMAGN